MRITSVRLRLALWNVGVLALVLSTFGAAIRYTDQVKLTANVDRELAFRADRLLGGRFARGDMPPPPPGFLPPGAGGWRPRERFGMGGRRPPPPGFGAPANGGIPPPFGRVPAQRWSPGRRERPPRGRRRGEWGLGGGGPLPRIGPFLLRPRYLDPAGRSLSGLASEGPWDPKAFARAVRGQVVHSTTVALNAPVRVLSVPLIRNGQVEGVLQLALPLTGVYEELGRLSGTLLMLFPVALLVAAVGGAFLTERALRPVRQITRAAAQIGACDLSERLPVKGRDEFSVLAATFNGMLGRLDQAFAQLAQALEQQRRFTADASHELRTPLTIIKANTSLALEEERSNAEYRRALEAADRAADTTNRIVQDLLLLARGDAGQLRLERRPNRISELLERAAEAFRRPNAPPISVRLSDPLLMVSGDPHHLIRLFSNLLENAVRHTPPTGSVTVSVDIAESGVVVRVMDTGEGIPPEHLPHVCERFYRVDTARTRRQGGTGLGLSICQTIVQAHHGSLAIDSIVGQGTTVTVELPRPASAATGDPTTPAGVVFAAALGPDGTQRTPRTASN